MKVIKSNNTQHISTSSTSYSSEVDKLKEELKAIDELKKETLKKYFIGDKHGNSPLSLAIEEENIKQIKEIYPISEELSNTELLAYIARDINDKEIRESYGITDDVAKRAYGEINDWFHLHGEDTTELVENCTLFGHIMEHE